MKIWSYIFSLFTEKKCFGCQKSGHFFCQQCNNNLELYSPYCYVCKKTSQNFSVHKDCQTHFPVREVIVFTRYRNTGIKKLLRHAKFYGKYRAYDDIIFPHSDFLSKYIETKASVLIPVPMHFLRRWKRGYNQTEEIAKSMSKVCQIPVENNFLVKRRYTRQQSHLSAEKRTKNLSHVFSTIDKNTVDKNSTIYLIDDVISTGSTIGEIAKFLHKNGYKDVRAIILASD